MPQDVGTNNIVLTAISPDIPNHTLTSSFNIIVVCQVSDMTITSSQVDLTHGVNQPEYLTTNFKLQQNPECKYPLTRTVVFELLGLVIAQPTFIE